jgi:DNA-binding HxlR family transcriptional regulator
MRLASDMDDPRFIVSLAKLARHPNAAVLCSLDAGPRRQNEMLAEFGTLTETTLSASLRELDGDQLVARRVDPGPPLRVLYELTPRGSSLASALKALRDWASRQA